MKNILLIAVILFAATAHGQLFTAGFRTGVGINYFKTIDKEYNWEKELFLRYETKSILLLNWA